MPKRRCVFFWNSFPTIDFECKDENDDNGCVYESVVLQWDRLELCTVNRDLLQWDASVLCHYQPLHLKCGHRLMIAVNIIIITLTNMTIVTKTPPEVEASLLLEPRWWDLVAKPARFSPPAEPWTPQWGWEQGGGDGGGEGGNPAIIIMIASSPVEETARGEEAPALPPSRSGLPSAKRLFFFSILAKRRRRMWLLRWWS